MDVLICSACGFHFWQGSKPAVGVVLLRVIAGKQQVLLTRRGIEPYKGQWDLPGGFLGNGERPEDGVRRELREELDVAVSNPRFFASEIDQYNRDDIAEQARFVLSLFFLCDIPADARLVPADDVVEAAWFPAGQAPRGARVRLQPQGAHESQGVLRRVSFFSPGSLRSLHAQGTR